MQFKIGKLYENDRKIVGQFRGYSDDNNPYFLLLGNHNFLVRENGCVYFDKSKANDFKLYQNNSTTLEKMRTKPL